jgi:carbon monoxide dehydrogenase subunit G
MKLLFRTQKNIDTVFTYLTDMQKFVSVHPIIYQIDSLGDGRYLVHETLKVGFIPFSFTYPVVIDKDSVSKKVVIRATVFKVTKIEMKFSLRTEHNYTVIEEDIYFDSLFPVKFIMQKVFKEQHQKLFNNIDTN